MRKLAAQRFAILLVAALLSVVWSTPARAYYKTITITGYYSIAVDGEYVWGGSSGWAAGWNDPAPKASVWRYKPADGTVQKWALPDAVGMNGPIAAIVPLTDQVLFLISGHGAASTNPRMPAPDATYNSKPDRTIDGGIVSYNRAAGTWSVIDLPVYDVQGYTLRGNDLWLSCGDQDNPRKFRAYRYNLVSKQLDPVDGMSDSHAIAIEPESDRGFTGTHHGKGLESFALSTMKFTAGTYGDAPQLPITEQVIDVSSPAPAPPIAKILEKPYLSLIKAMVKIDNQLWVAEPMGAYYASWFGGIALIDLPSLKTKWASPSTWQYRDFGDETALDLKLDPTDNAIIWVSGAKGLFKLHRTETPPRLEQIDIDGLLDHNFQHIALDSKYIWAGTEQGYLYRFDKTANQWALAGNWQTSFTVPALVKPREVPAAVQNVSGMATNGQTHLTWQMPGAPTASSYFVSRDDVLIGLTGATTFDEPSPPPRSHKYTIVPNEAPYLKGGLLGPGASVTVTVAGSAPTAPTCTSRPAKIQWGLGEMSYVASDDLYVDVYEFPNTKGVYPMTCVTWPQAKQLAAWQGKRLPTHAEYEVISQQSSLDGGVGYPDYWLAYNTFRARKLEPSGAIADSVDWGLYDVPGNVMEWQDGYSPLGDGHTYGLAAGGTYAEVAFDWRVYAPYAEYPVGSWARDINRYNHSEIGFRAVMSATQVMHLINPSCPADPKAGAPEPPPVSDAGVGAGAGAEAGAGVGAGADGGGIALGPGAQAGGGVLDASAAGDLNMGVAAEGNGAGDAGCACRVGSASSRDGGNGGVVVSALLAIAAMCGPRRSARGQVASD